MSYLSRMSLDKLVLLISLIFILRNDGVFSLDLEKCKDELGMRSKEIPDSAITASSSFDDNMVGPKSARIRTEVQGGAWCPSTMISRDTYEYLQIDLSRLTVVSAVEVQGRFGNGQGKEYTESFLLEYQREEGGEWVRFRDKKGNEVFQGNSNTYIAVMRPVSPPVVVSRIRFIPYSLYTRTICMRVEIYGCPWQDGVLSYSVRQGDRRGSEVDFYDFSYDGMIRDSYLLEGLGQLMDGEIGGPNFRLDPQGLGIRGYEWVGWRNDSGGNTNYVEIMFKFETVRNFSSVIFTCNNYFTRDVRAFRSAWVYFSIGGKHFLSEPVIYDVIQDLVSEDNRIITIDLEHNTGRFVKVKLFFDAKWMLISEIQFNSVELRGIFDEEKPLQIPEKPKNKNTQSDQAVIKEFNVFGTKDDDSSDTQLEEPKTEESKNKDFISIIIAALIALIVTLTIIIVIVVVRSKRRRQRNEQHLKSVNNQLMLDYNNLHRNSTGKTSSGTMYSSVATEDTESSKQIQNDSSEYTEPSVTKAALVVKLPPEPPSQRTSLPQTSTDTSGVNLLDKPPTYDALYAAADVINCHVPNIPSLQGVSGNSVYAVPNIDLLPKVETSAPEFPRRNLRFVEVLGQGQFGEVHLCEAVGIPEQYNEDGSIYPRSSGPALVALKILRTSADDRARRDFLREIKVMSMLRDLNIVRVLGVCTRGEPMCMIVEYMRYGDLHQFLLNHFPEGNGRVAPDRTISYGSQIYMASQIASGMKYLESLNMVHRDLAARNCLVGSYYTIKITDFGMSRSLYSSDYYRIEGRAVLPIRWMAWESTLLGKFTTKSDVWSFAVTLWEILTFARSKPFAELSDEQVIENAGHYYRNDNEETYLGHPQLCPKEIYDLMCECWNRQESERPSFREINMFLMRKNMGYDPKDECVEELEADLAAC